MTPVTSSWESKMTTREQARKYRSKNRQRLNRYKKAWYLAHLESERKKRREYSSKPEVKARRAADYALNRESVLAKKKAYRESHRELVSLQKRRSWEKHRGRNLLVQREYYLKNKDKINERARMYSEKNREKLIAYQREYRASGRRKELGRTLRGRYQNYKDSAKNRGLVFDITKEEFETFWQKPCYYCGSQIETVGLDRIDNQIGYLASNVISCCKNCNYAKNDRSQQDFIDHCRRVSALHPAKET